MDSAIEVWKAEHHIALTHTLDTRNKQVMFEIGAGSGAAQLLVLCDDGWRAFGASSRHPALARPADQVAAQMSECAMTPLDVLVRVARLSLGNDPASASTSTTASSTSNSATSWLVTVMPHAVECMADKGRPQFEIAERVRIVRQLVDAGRIDEAKRRSIYRILIIKPYFLFFTIFLKKNKTKL